MSLNDIGVGQILYHRQINKGRPLFELKNDVTSRTRVCDGLTEALFNISRWVVNPDRVAARYRILDSDRAIIAENRAAAI